MQPKKLFLILSAVTSLSAAQSGLVVIDAPGIRMRVDRTMQTELTGLAPMSPSETIAVGGREVSAFALSRHRARRISDKLGAGREHVLTGESAEGLRKELTIVSYDAFPGFLVLQARYTNAGAAPVEATGWTNHHYSLPAAGGGEPAFWSFQSGSYESRPNWVLPLKPGFRQDNFMGMNNIDYGGGTPVSDVWRRDVGLASRGPIGQRFIDAGLVSRDVGPPAV